VEPSDAAPIRPARDLGVRAVGLAFLVVGSLNLAAAMLLVLLGAPVVTAAVGSPAFTRFAVFTALWFMPVLVGAGLWWHRTWAPRAGIGLGGLLSLASLSGVDARPVAFAPGWATLAMLASTVYLAGRSMRSSHAAAPGAPADTSPTTRRATMRLAGGLGLLLLAAIAVGTELVLLGTTTSGGLDLLGIWIATAMLAVLAVASLMAGVLVLALRQRDAPAVVGAALSALAALYSLAAGAPIWYPLMPALVALALFASIRVGPVTPRTDLGRQGERPNAKPASID
jgi:hypothetical protein